MTTDAIRDGALAARQAEGHDEEADLVRQAKARSPRAWTEIYERNQPKLFRYLLSRVGDRDLAEDLTATVFLEALRRIDSYQWKGRPLLAWLYSIARNTANYHHRTRYRRKNIMNASIAALSRLLPVGRRERAADMGTAESGDAADPDSNVEKLDLQQAVGRLSRDQREVIILRYFVGLTTPETASVLGKRERAVYSLQARAIKSLRRQLTGDYEDFLEHQSSQGGREQ